MSAGAYSSCPFLIALAGLGQHEAEATSLLVVLPTAVVATITLRRRGMGDLTRALLLGSIGAAGAAAGALVARLLAASTLREVFAVFLGLVGLRLASDEARSLRRGSDRRQT